MSGSAVIASHSEANTTLQKILGFLRQESNTEAMDIETRLNERITVLEAMNTEVMDENQKLEFKNAMLED